MKFSSVFAWAAARATELTTWLGLMVAPAAAYVSQQPIVGVQALRHALRVDVEPELVGGVATALTVLSTGSIFVTSRRAAQPSPADPASPASASLAGS